MADKWDQLAQAVVESAPAEDKGAAQTVMGVAADVGRMLEQMGADLDRIATALEKVTEILEARRG
jgi:uncharacterized membrane protein YjjP (DUF1212 family)